jgi:RimJ/RimL family protein N-acetyltransferase
LDRERIIPQPRLTTARLVLRPLVLDDARDVQRLAGNIAIASTVLHIPHPYPAGAAEGFITAQNQAWAEGKEGAWAITREGALVGCIALHFLSPKNDRAGLGYWIGHPDWGKGYASEAGRAVVEWAFARGWQRVQADHIVGNVRSGRVMLKIGMHYEGRMRAYYKKGDTYFDVEQYAILRDDR